MNEDDERRTWGERRDSTDDRLRRLEIAVAVLETTTREIKGDVAEIKADTAHARNYALATLIGGFAFVMWAVITKGLGH